MNAFDFEHVSSFVVVQLICMLNSSISTQNGMVWSSLYACKLLNLQHFSLTDNISTGISREGGNAEIFA